MLLGPLCEHGNSRDARFCNQCATRLQKGSNGKCGRNDSKDKVEAGRNFNQFPNLGIMLADRLGFDADAEIHGVRFLRELFFCTSSFSEEAWDMVRSRISNLKEQMALMKEEPESSDDDHAPDSDQTLEVNIRDIYNLQSTCSSTFKNGESLQSLITALICKEQDPMRDDRLILSVAKANLRRPDLRSQNCSKIPKVPVYFTFDHRRLHCLGLGFRV